MWFYPKFHNMNYAPFAWDQFGSNQFVDNIHLHLIKSSFCISLNYVSRFKAAWFSALMSINCPDTTEMCAMIEHIGKISYNKANYAMIYLPFAIMLPSKVEINILFLQNSLKRKRTIQWAKSRQSTLDNIHAKCRNLQIGLASRCQLLKSTQHGANIMQI